MGEIGVEGMGRGVCLRGSHCLIVGDYVSWWPETGGEVGRTVFESDGSWRYDKVS